MKITNIKPYSFKGIKIPPEADYHAGNFSQVPLGMQDLFEKKLDVPTFEEAKKVLKRDEVNKESKNLADKIVDIYRSIFKKQNDILEKKPQVKEKILEIKKEIEELNNSAISKKTNATISPKENFAKTLTYFKKEFCNEMLESNNIKANYDLRGIAVFSKDAQIGEEMVNFLPYYLKLSSLGDDKALTHKITMGDYYLHPFETDFKTVKALDTIDEAETAIEDFLDESKKIYNATGRNSFIHIQDFQKIINPEVNKEYDGYLKQVVESSWSFNRANCIGIITDKSKCDPDIIGSNSLELRLEAPTKETLEHFLKHKEEIEPVLDEITELYKEEGPKAWELMKKQEELLSNYNDDLKHLALLYEDPSKNKENILSFLNLKNQKPEDIIQATKKQANETLKEQPDDIFKKTANEIVATAKKGKSLVNGIIIAGVAIIGGLIYFKGKKAKKSPDKDGSVQNIAEVIASPPNLNKTKNFISMNDFKNNTLKK